MIKEEKVLGHCAESDSESYRIEQVSLDPWLTINAVSVSILVAFSRKGISRMFFLYKSLGLKYPSLPQLSKLWKKTSVRTSLL